MSMKISKSQLRQLIKEEFQSIIQEAGWKYKNAVDQQIIKARNWRDFKAPLGEITEMIDELWRNWYADHVVVRELDPATKVADDIKRKNYRVPDPSGKNFPKLNLKEQDASSPSWEQARFQDIVRQSKEDASSETGSLQGLGDNMQRLADKLAPYLKKVWDSSPPGLASRVHEKVIEQVQQLIIWKRSVDKRLDKLEKAYRLQNEGYPGLQGEDITTVANGPPRKK